MGALAARLELPYEQMDDLQLAVETILREQTERGSVVTLEVNVGHELLEVAVGPVKETSPAETGTEDGLTRGRLLGVLVDRVELVERDGRTWLRLEESIAGGRVPSG